jgi:sec-independent protein translocase protein TatC
MTEDSPANDSGKNQSLVSHLVELRARLLRALACVLLIFAGLSFYAGDLYSLVARPLLEHLAPGTGMIATEVASTFIAPIKLAFFLALFIAMPYILYQMWSFVAPGLYRNERRFALPLLISSIVLFYAGTAFAFFVILPVLFGFFTAIAPEGVVVMTDISRYLDFILKIFFAFGLAFEVPVLTMLLIWSGITTVDDLKHKRPYIIVAAFVIGMLLTPPDVMSQLLLAFPVWFLFELGLWLASKLLCREQHSDAQQS